MSELHLYFRYVRLHMLTQLEYRGWYLEILMTLFVVITDPLDAFIMLDRFGDVGGMSASAILLVYALAVCAFGLAELFGRGFDSFPFLIKNGEFDRALLRPRSTVLQAMTLRFHINRVARVIGMLALIGMCLRAQGVALGAREWALLIMALMGGALTYTGIFIMASVVAMFTIEAVDLVYIFTNGSYQVAKAPPRLLPDWLRRTFTYVVPMFPFCYFPAAAICRWPGEHMALGYLALPVGAAFLGIALILWRWGVRHYTSTGS